MSNLTPSREESSPGLPPITEQTNFWKISPGEQGYLWNRCRRDRCITIGWPKVGDVRRMSRPDFDLRRTELAATEPGYTPAGVEQVWRFVREIKVGDRVLANRGFSQVLGLGVITGPCEYIEGNNIHYRHRWPVDWYDTGSRKMSNAWRQTLIKLQREQFEAVEESPVTTVQQIYKFSPDATRWSWEESLNENGTMLRDDNLGDVGMLHPVIDFEGKLRQFESRADKAEAKFIWDFSLVPRDSLIVAVDRDSGRVLGHGQTTGEYFYAEDAPKFQHRLPVKWWPAHSELYDLPDRSETLVSIDETQWILLGGDPIQVREPINDEEQIDTEMTMLPAFPLNQILYGPPGTGKTHSSIARAVEIIDGFVPTTRPETVARFEELRSANRIGFVTFHQSFAYEEFIEGLRPVLDDEGDGTARYEIRDGVFKEMALRALAATLQEMASTSAQGRAVFEQLWDEMTRRMEESDSYEIQGRHKTNYRLTLSDRDVILGENTAGTAKNPYRASRKTIRQVWEASVSSDVPSRKRIYEILGHRAHSGLIASVIAELRRIAGESEFQLSEEDVKFDRTSDIESAQDYLAGTGDADVVPSNERFVLIIDEINRGNIARIFGELITLLEADKRLGAENELRVKLPYSQETFGVPGNLYVLGTMNTADKSLALLDIALRRRFAFVELRPNFSICPNLDETMRRVLQTLNNRLMLVLDREHRLGHAAWIPVQTRAQWNEVFLRQVVPLLQEYFYNDWESLRSVLGETGEGEIIRQLDTGNVARARTRYGWWFDYDEQGATPDFLSVLAKNLLRPQAAAGTTDINQLSPDSFPQE